MTLDFRILFYFLGVVMREVVDYGVLGFLLFLSIVVVAIGIERAWFYATVRVDDYNDKRLLELDLHKRLTLVATIGSNAPYIGLLGTVFGIMVTFIEIGNNTLLDTIPSIVFYNLLVRKAEVVLTKWDIYHNPSNIAPKSSSRLDKESDK